MDQQNNPYEYYAFLSYKREDEEWAKWLQRKLESFSLPTALRKKNPTLPNKIRPIFRDQSDLSGGNLKAEIEKGLNSSKYLIVICSPRSSKSSWVSKEVQHFINQGREEKIIPFIISGVPNATNPEDECFPDCLRQLTGDKEILGININEMGRDAAAIKVIAQMFGLRFDSLWQRHERNKKRRVMAILAFAIISLISALCIAYLYYDRNNAYAAISRTNWELMEKHALSVASTAVREIDKGNVLESIFALLSVTPKSNEIPYVPEVEHALRLAYDKFYSNEWIYTELDGYYDYIYLTSNELYLICENAFGIDILNATNGMILKHINRNHSGNDDLTRLAVWGSLSSKNGLQLYVIDDNDINHYDIEADSFTACSNNIADYVNDLYFPCGIYRFQSMFNVDENNKVLSISPNFNYFVSIKEEVSASNGECISYVLSDRVGNILFSLNRDCYNNLFFDYLDITNISFSLDEKLMLLSYQDGHNEIRTLVNPSDYRIWNTSIESAHYSNKNYFASNDRIIHTSAFEDKIKIYDANTLSLVDSVYFVGTNYIEGSYVCVNKEFNKLWTIQLDNPVMYEKYADNIVKTVDYDSLEWNIVNEVICENVKILSKDKKIYCTNADGDVLWVHESSLDSLLFGTFDNNRLIVVMDNKPRGCDELVFLERNTGKEVYRYYYNFFDSYINDNASSILLLASCSDERNYEILGYRQLVNACEKIVEDRTMTQKGRALFNTIH